MLLTIYHVVSSDGNIYKAYRLALTGSRSGVARNAHTVIAAQLLAYAQRHFAGGFAADSAVFGQRICLYIEQLLLSHERIARGGVKEVILAISTSVEGETTLFYLMNRLRQFPGLKVTSIARGIGFGDELEYVDELTITHALMNRREIE